GVLSAESPGHGSIGSDAISGGLVGVAVGSTHDGWGGGAVTEHRAFWGVIGRWDGSAWAAGPAPDPGPGPADLSGVDAVSATDVWAVGQYLANKDRALIEHWDGTEWSQIPSPVLRPPSGLSAVSAVSTGDIWAVGSTYLRNFDTSHALALHWDGSAWSR